MTEQWLGYPEVVLTADSISIEQHVQVSNIRTRDELTVKRYADGSVQLTSRGDGPVSIPAHWIPLVNEFLVRSEVIG